MTLGPARILHLSDLHARGATEWDARPLLHRLADAVEALREEGLGPDLVAITGDLAFSGQEREYELVTRWLQKHLLPAAGLDATALLIVPGNHDVDRRACASTTVASLEAALRGGDQEKIAEVLQDPDQKRILDARYTAYRDFLEAVGVSHRPDTRWATRREIRGLGLQLVGLDTAWLASEDPGQGRLALGLAALNGVLPPLRRDNPDLVVALAHHPLSWLVERDQAAVVPPLRARAHLLLRGHLHDPDYTLTTTPQHRLIELPAGASYAGHRWPMSFQLVELDPTKARVRLYTWHPAWDRWVPDRTRLPPDGVAELPLR